jgi:beta-lactamase class A
MVTASATATPPATATATVLQASGPYDLDEPHCGILLPVTLDAPPPVTAPFAVTSLPAAVPAAAAPALQELLQHPARVSLVAYELGQEAEGIFLNAATPVPLASVVKLVHLVAYAAAVQNGELDPEEQVPLADLERYYLAGSDLNAHQQAVAALRDAGVVTGEPPSVALSEVPRMMIEFSSNAATDYLHMLLGQERIEQTARDLGMSGQAAPCPFLGQFLLMGQGDESLAAVQQLIADPAQYSVDVMSTTLAFSEGSAATTTTWRGRWRRPTLEAQQLFSAVLNSRGTARAYADLMARIATNQLGPWEQNVRIRRYLEWPTQFPINQEKLAWIGYKGGSLPGVLTVAYYAQPWDRAQPVVVALFFHDLPLDTFRTWRQNLPHDELARWLLRERDAIPTLRALLQP